MNARRPLRWSYLGRLPYGLATRLQEIVRRDLRAGICVDHLLLLEHPHVYTLGRGASRSDVLASEEWLSGREIDVAESDRGGQVTYHGPGQLVGYPVIDLNPDRRDIRRYVRDLQEVIVRTLGDFDIDARAESRQSRIGVWVGGLKIASIGVHLSRWITTHGFALNVSTDLSYFESIVPCGLADVQMTSIESLTGHRPELGDVASVVAVHFAAVFGRRPEQVPAGELRALDGLAAAGSETPDALVAGAADARQW